MTVVDQRGRRGDWRLRFSWLTLVSTTVLLGWGAFVTSIDAGLAVPDWPATMDSYNPFNPWPQWWTATPLLAEHGHRLIAMIVGLLTVILAGWNWKDDARRYVKILSAVALFLVVFQGVLGGLRVVLTSLDLAVVHACVAQLFFCSIAALTLFNSRSWLETSPSGYGLADSRIKALSVFLSIAIYIQIVFGALLRHPGTGIDTVLAVTHIVWAFVVACLLVLTSTQVLIKPTTSRAAKKWAGILIAVLVVQVLLGITAYFVLIDEQGMTVPSNLQVTTNTLHMVTGAILLASSVVLALLTNYRSSLRSPSTQPATVGAPAVIESSTVV